MRLAGLACGKDLALKEAALALDLIGDKDRAGAVEGPMESSLLSAPGVSAQMLALGGELALEAGRAARARARRCGRRAHGGADRERAAP